MTNWCIWALLLCFSCIIPLSAQSPAKPAKEVLKAKPPKMHKVAMFGIGVSFTDSVVYQTELQVLDSVWIQPSHNFLEDRSLYSFQLQCFMELQGVKNSICSVVFDKNVNRVRRKWNKVNKRHRQSETQHFRVVPLSEFKFKPEEYRPVIVEETE